MTLMEQIRADQLTARKAKNAVASALLTTLIGEASQIGKNAGNRESTDAEVVATVQKFIKNIDITLQHTTSEVAVEEKKILENYLPKQLSQMQIMAEIAEVCTVVTDKKLLKGAIMKHFKDKFAGQYDAKLVLQVAEPYMQ